jgi:hypothetical protein
MLAVLNYESIRPLVRARRRRDAPRPGVTQYYWDLPQEFEDTGAWPNRDTACRFADLDAGLRPVQRGGHLNDGRLRLTCAGDCGRSASRAGRRSLLWAVRDGDDKLGSGKNISRFAP